MRHESFAPVGVPVLQEAPERARQLLLPELPNDRLYGLYRQRARRPRGDRGDGPGTTAAAGRPGSQ